MWYFKSPEIVFGEGALEALDELEGQRALIVTDATLVELGVVHRVRTHLDKAGIETHVFDGVEPDPTVDLLPLFPEPALRKLSHHAIAKIPRPSSDFAHGLVSELYRFTHCYYGLTSVKDGYR